MGAPAVEVEGVLRERVVWADGQDVCVSQSPAQMAVSFGVPVLQV